MCSKTLAAAYAKHGHSPAKIAKLMHLSENTITSYIVSGKKMTGDPSVHHKEKADQIVSVMAGLRNRVIYETNGFMGNGEPGVCTKVYSHFGRVISKSENDGDWVAETRRTVVRGDSCTDMDIDGYRSPEKVIEAGIFELFDPAVKGFLFTTWNIGQTYARRPVLRNASLIDHGTHCPSSIHYEVFVKKMAGKLGILATTLSTVKMGGIYRIAFRMERLSMAPQVASHSAAVIYRNIVNTAAKAAQGTKCVISSFS